MYTWCHPIKQYWSIHFWKKKHRNTAFRFYCFTRAPVFNEVMRIKPPVHHLRRDRADTKSTDNHESCQLGKMASPIKFIDVTLSPLGDARRETLGIIKNLRPEWIKEDVVVDKMTGGILNTSWCCRQGCDLGREDALIVRIYGDSVTGLVCRDEDFYGMQLAHTLGCFPSVCCCFNNGVVYKYVKGKMVTYTDLMDPNIIDNLTRNLKRLHMTSPNQTGLINWRGEVASHRFKRSNAVDFIRKVVSLIPECQDTNKRDEFELHRKDFSDDVLLKECDFLQNTLADFNLLLVLLHNDIHHGNLVLNEDDEGITILDYELMAMDYEHHDIAFLMMSWHILGPLGYAGPDVATLTDEIREAYIKSYLHAKYEKGNGNQPTNKQVELVSMAVRILETVACLRYIATAMLFVNIGGERDELTIIGFAKNIYVESEPKVRSLHDNYMRLKAELRVDDYW